MAQVPSIPLRQYVPTIDFYNLNFVASMGHYQDDDWHGYSFNGPSQSVKQLAAAVAAQNAILTVPAPSLNSSWELAFAGPRLKCEDVTSATKTEVQDNIARYLFKPLDRSELGLYALADNCSTPPAFLAWYSGDSPGSGPYLPATSANDSELMSTMETRPGQDLAFYVAVLPQTLLVNATTGCLTSAGIDNLLVESNPLGPWGEDMTLLRCDLYNTTYQANFTSVNGVQEIDAQTPYPERDTTIPSLRDPQGWIGGPGRVRHLFGGSDIVGNNATCTTLNYYPAAPCSYNASVLPVLAYRSVLEAFGQLIMGNISMIAPVASEATASRQLTDSSRIRTSGLMNTKELGFLSEYAIHQGVGPIDLDLQGILFNSSRPEISAISGVSRLPRPDEKGLLKDALEIMFQNITMSLMSSPAFRPDPAVPDTLSEATVTMADFRTVYFYAESKLWVAYGAAVASAAIAVAVGLLSMFTHGAAYSNKFSTAFLAGRSAELSVEVHSSDLQARDPLPSYLDRAKVALKHGDTVELQPVQAKGSDGVIYSSVRQAD